VTPRDASLARERATPRVITLPGYRVTIAPGSLDDAGAIIAAAAPAHHYAIVSDPNVAPLYAERVRASLAGAASGATLSLLLVPAGEEHKTRELWAHLTDELLASGAGRDTTIIALGGGVVGDLAGFVAATYMRGIPVVQLPTTLLAMVDASVGGKTGVDTPAGKNLVGAFHPPAGVLADLNLLATLPAVEYRSGLAEVIKAGFIADPPILDLVEADPVAAAAAGGPAERELIERAIRMKAAVVSADLREAGQREMLNYGHTLGHAIERAEGYRMRHGEAVSIGMVFAATVAALAGRLSTGDADRHRAVLTSVGLPVSYQPGAWPRLRETMAVDKKTRGARLRLVVLDGSHFLPLVSRLSLV